MAGMPHPVGIKREHHIGLYKNLFFGGKFQPANALGDNLFDLGAVVFFTALDENRIVAFREPVYAYMVLSLL